MRRYLTSLALALAILASASPPAGAFPTSGFSIYTIAGDATTCMTAPMCGDGGAATSAQLNDPEAVAVDGSGNVYIADAANNEIRRLTPAGTITTVAGDGQACHTAPNCGDGGPATQAKLNFPEGIAVDHAGNLYVSDVGDYELREVSTAGVITTIAGDGRGCAPLPNCGDGGLAMSAAVTPVGVAVDAHGTVYIGDFGANEVRKVSGGMISRVAGTGSPCPNAGQPGPTCGDGGPATQAQLTQPTAVAVDGNGDVFVADTNDQEIRLVAPTGTITTVAGTGVPCHAAPACGDGGPAARAQLWAPNGLALDAVGNLYIADANNAEVRRVTPAGTITRVAGDGVRCSTAPACGDGGSATTAQLNSDDGVAADGAGNVYIADSADNEIRWLSGPRAGPQGPTGPAGQPGPPGPTGAPGHDGRLVVVAYAAFSRHGRLTLRYALTAPASVTLAVGPGHGRRSVVLTLRAHAGLDQLVWNERMHGRPVRHGNYTLTVTAIVAGRHTSSAIHVRL